LLELLRDGQPWKKQEIQQLINDEFDVSFHPAYLPVFLEELGLSYAIPRTKRPSRPDNAEEPLLLTVPSSEAAPRTPAWVSGCACSPKPHILACLSSL